MFSWYKYLIVNLVFSHLGFWSGNFFLIAPFPDLCLLVPSYGFRDLRSFFFFIKKFNVVMATRVKVLSTQKQYATFPLPSDAVCVI